MCSIPGPVRRSPWPPRRLTPPSWSLMDLMGLYLGDVLGTVGGRSTTPSFADWKPCRKSWNRCWHSTEDVQYFASRYFNHDSIFFIGRNLDYAMGLEGSLKLKEISYIHSEAYASGELKHGTISLIEPGTLVVALGTYEPLFDKAMSNVVEVKGPWSRGAGAGHGAASRRKWTTRRTAS